MDEQTVTLNTGGVNPTGCGPTHASQFDQPHNGIMKFTYASGSSPLDGYTIKRGIGIGGFGEVYFATSDTGKEVALKHIQRNLDIELRGVSQCLNLKHPNLIALYNIRYDNHGSGWVVMEYVSGESLKDAIDAYPNGMPLDLMQDWLQGIAAGTAYLHDHGIVHRDLKPGNVFVDEGLVKIGDYGLSKFISVSRRSGQTESVGTFHYMAPEIGKGSYGKEIDIYALGVVVFEMLAGKVPFDGESSQEIIMKHLTDEPDLTQLPDRFRKIVSKALAKDPANRYSSVVEMAHDLDLDIGTPKVISFAPPPIAIPADPPESDNETFYIGDDNAAEGVDPEIMLLGPVQQHSDHQTDQTEASAQSHKNPKTGEPIADAVRCGWQRSRDWWKNARLYTPLKFLLLILTALLLLGNAGWLLPLTITSIFLYLGYLGLRGLVLEQPRSTPAVATAKRAPPAGATIGATGARRGTGHHPHRSWRESCQRMLREKSRPERVMELTGSMLMSALVVAVLGIVSLIIANQDLSGDIVSWAPTYAWLTLTCVAGTWSVLAMSKSWEGYKPDPALRRFSMLVLGLAIGALSFGLSQLLLVQPGYLLVGESSVGAGWPESMYSAAGEPQFLAYLGYFAGLLLVLRMWRHADPLRTTRLSLWGTGACVLWALVLHLFLPFPRGFMIAAIVSVALQLSAPWIEVADRNRMRQQARRTYV